jgi:hypothetical protein
MATASVKAIEQPKFDSRISKLAYPLNNDKKGVLKRGFMQWYKPMSGYSNVAHVYFLYNPSTVSASYPASDSSVAASLMFPSGFDTTNLAVPLYQSVEFSLLFDRTYELWDSVGPDANTDPGVSVNNPAVVGVMADIIQMKQFTGMNIGYTTGNNNSPTSTSTSSIQPGQQGIVQMVPSYVYFGDTNNLWYYGYVSEWDVTVTHWNQNMVPMRCVIDVSWAILPLPTTGNNSAAPGNSSNTNWTVNPPSTSGHQVTLFLFQRREYQEDDRS